MNKIFQQALTFAFTVAMVLSFTTVSAQSSGRVKVFMQPDSYIGSKTQYGNNPEAGHYALVDDAKIYYEVYGEGNPIVILHGGGVGCTYEMGQFIDSLSKTNKVIAISTRGHGKSEIGTKPVSVEQRANDVYSVIQDCVPGQKVKAIGFSDGGYSAYFLAYLHPEVVDRIVTIGAGEALPHTRKFIKSKIEDMAALDPDFMELQMKICPQPDKKQAYWDNFYDFYNTVTVSKEILNSIKCPVLVMAGELDPNAPLATVIAAYYMLPHSQLAIIPNAGHGAFIDNFQAVWDCVVPFLSE
ncbi:MAG: alpha/beta hydrolase [Bacteroides sp.]|nr:alpha/beta hydrolase [Bacteroides sp.]